MTYSGTTYPASYDPENATVKVDDFTNNVFGTTDTQLEVTLTTELKGYVTTSVTALTYAVRSQSTRYTVTLQPVTVQSEIERISKAKEDIRDAVNAFSPSLIPTGDTIDRFAEKIGSVSGMTNIIALEPPTKSYCNYTLQTADSSASTFTTVLDNATLPQSRATLRDKWLRIIRQDSASQTQSPSFLDCCQPVYGDHSTPVNNRLDLVDILMSFSSSFASGTTANVTIFSPSTLQQFFANVDAGTHHNVMFLAVGVSCMAKGTLVTLADGTRKKIEDVTFDDTLLTWDFTSGSFAAVHPILIKRPQTAPECNVCRFSDGSVLKLVGSNGYHRILNLQKGAFTHTGAPDTPNGTLTLNDRGETPVLVSQTVVREPVEFYNVITEAPHYSLFANGILTSCRLSNSHPIDGTTLKYDTATTLITEEETAAYIQRLKDSPLWMTNETV